MTGVVLAECGGQVWLVGGEEHLDAVLRGLLPAEVAVEYLVVEHRREVFALWGEKSGASDSDMPWLINPALLGGIRGRFGPSRRSVRFTPWSVMLDAEAEAALADVATWLAARPERRLLVRQFAAADPAPGQADLQRLRGQMAIGALSRAGVDASRLSEEMAAASGAQDAERMELVEEEPAL